MRIIHVVGSDQRRGAEVFAADLAGALRGKVAAQLVAVIRGADPPGVSFPCPTIRLGGRGGGAELPASVRLSRLVAEWRPSLVHVHGGDALRTVVAAAPRSRAPVVLRHIGMVRSRATSGFRRLAYGLLMRRADRVVTVSDAVRRQAIDVFRLSPRQVVSIPNAVDPSRMRAGRDRSSTRASLGIPHSAPVVLSVGALTWEKGLEAHLRVGAEVLRRVRDAVHLMVGDGPLQARLRREVGRRGLNGRLRMLGERRDVPDLMGASDVLLIASRLEGMPGVAIEAGIMSLPVAAFGVGGVSEVIEDGTSGFVVPAGDARRLAGAVEHLIQDTDDRRRTGEAARSICMGRFTIDSVVPRYLGVYREAMES